MISLAMVLMALTVLSSLGCWLLVRGLWPAGERDYQAYGLAASGLLLLLGAVALLAWKLPVFFNAAQRRMPPLEMPEGNIRVDFPWSLEVETDTLVRAPDERPSTSETVPAGQAAEQRPPVDMTDDTSLPARDDWPATDCVVRYRAPELATGAMRWYLRNECGRPVAVVFAWCDFPATECWSAQSDRAGLRWHYVEEGVVLTAGDTNLPAYDQRSGAPAVQMPTDQVFADHLACYIESQTATAFLSRSHVSGPVPMQGEEAEMAEISDECLRVMRSCSRYGNTIGRSPGTLFR